MIKVRSITAVRAYVGLGHLLFFGLLVLAAIHWRERTIHVDSACQIFKWIQGDGLQVEAHRYAAIGPQLLVKLGVLFGAGLSTLLLIASVAHVLLPWLVYAIIAHGLRRPWIAVSMALATVLCTRLSFYGIVLEANYLVSYPFLLAAVLDQRAAGTTGRASAALAFAALALVLLVHPLGFLAVLYIAALFLLRSTSDRRLLFAISAGALLWAAFNRFIFPPTNYEQGLYAKVGAGLPTLGLDAPNAAWDFLIGHSWMFTTMYLPLWVLFALLSVLLVGRNAWSALALVLVASAGYMILILATYHAGESAVMMEKNFLPLALFVSLPLVFELAHTKERWQRFGLLPFALVLFIQFRTISFASRPAHERLALLEKVVADVRMEGTAKAAVPSRTLNDRGLHIHWALSFETMLLSSVDGPTHCVVVRTVDTDTFQPNSGVHLPTMSDALPISQLKGRYFVLPDGPDRFTTLDPIH